MEVVQFRPKHRLYLLYHSLDRNMTEPLWHFYSVCLHILAALYVIVVVFCLCSVLAVRPCPVMSESWPGSLAWLPCSGCPVLAALLSWLSCPGCPVLLACPRRPDLDVLSWISCPRRPVLDVLSLTPSCSCCPVLAVLSWQSCLVILSQQSCSASCSGFSSSKFPFPSCPVLLDLFWLPL